MLLAGDDSRPSDEIALPHVDNTDSPFREFAGSFVIASAFPSYSDPSTAVIMLSNIVTPSNVLPPPSLKPG